MLRNLRFKLVRPRRSLERWALTRVLKFGRSRLNRNRIGISRVYASLLRKPRYDILKSSMRTKHFLCYISLCCSLYCYFKRSTMTRIPRNYPRFVIIYSALTLICVNFDLRMLFSPVRSRSKNRNISFFFLSDIDIRVDIAQDKLDNQPFTCEALLAFH